MSDNGQPEGADRRDYSPTHGERENVLAYLRNYRITFEMKCEGLDAEQLARRSVPPSTLSLLGLVRHLAKVEHSWNRRVLQGHPEIPLLYRTESDRDADFNGAVPDPAVVEEAWASWRREVAAADAWIDQDTDWDRTVRVHDDEIEVRDVMVHLVEEYARHVGHADLLRECIDGRTGQ
ncbi:MAG: DinB family protein [Nocardioides sp.]|nr:DinB family protein [Nocardioidaceae bacterium]MCB8958186.1 DinB family protein [Nocardioides sp.]